MVGGEIFKVARASVGVRGFGAVWLEWLGATETSVTEMSVAETSVTEMSVTEMSVADGNADKKKTRRNGTGLDLEGVNRRN